MWLDEKGILLVIEVRDGVLEFDFGEEFFKFLGRSDLLICMWL